MISIDYTNVIFLGFFLIAYYCYMSSPGKLGDRYTGPRCTILATSEYYFLTKRHPRIKLYKTYGGRGQ